VALPVRGLALAAGLYLAGPHLLRYTLARIYTPPDPQLLEDLLVHITLNADGDGGGILIQGTEDELMDLADSLIEAAEQEPGRVEDQMITDDGVERFTIERIAETP